MSDSRIPTILDLADASGKSRSTVSRVLTGSPRVSEEARASVLAAMERIGYRVNLAARSLRTSKSALVGLLVPALTNGIFAEIAEGVDLRLREQGIGLLVGSSGWNLAGDLLVIDAFEARGVDGIIVASSTDRHPEFTARLRACRAPLILLDRDISRAGADAVLTDHRAGIAEALGHLAELGHRRIGLVSASTNTRPGREVLAALRGEASRLSLDDDVTLLVQRDEFDLRAGSAAADQLCNASATAAVVSGPVAVVAGFLDALDVRGVTVPRDMSIVAYSDEILANLIRPPLTGIVRSAAEECNAVSGMVLSRLADPDGQRRVETIATRLRVASSTAASPVRPQQNRNSLVPRARVHEVSGDGETHDEAPVRSSSNHG